MSCRGCGRDWDGSNVYCPICLAQSYTSPAPCAAPNEPTKTDEILTALHEVTRLLREIEYHVRSRS
jgi:hypothetical protein